MRACHWMERNQASGVGQRVVRESGKLPRGTAPQTAGSGVRLVC